MKKLVLICLPPCETNSSQVCVMVPVLLKVPSMFATVRIWSSFLVPKPSLLMVPWSIKFAVAPLSTSVHQHFYKKLFGTCTSLYQLVQVIKVHQVKSQQAKSKSWQVFCLKLFLDLASHDKLARPYKFSNFCSHWFERYGFK